MRAGDLILDQWLIAKKARGLDPILAGDLPDTLVRKDYVDGKAMTPGPAGVPGAGLKRITGNSCGTCPYGFTLGPSVSGALHAVNCNVKDNTGTIISTYSNDLRCGSFSTNTGWFPGGGSFAIGGSPSRYVGFLDILISFQQKPFRQRYRGGFVVKCRLKIGKKSDNPVYCHVYERP